jgi:Tol biopolymer transport system component
MSADGRYVAFDTGPTPAPGSARRGVHVYDRTTGRTARVSVSSGGTQGNGNSERARLSANGRYVTFDSAATDLVPGDTNRASDLFFHDRSTGKTSRTSMTSTGAQIGGGHSSAGDISSDGRSVAFSTAARDVVPGDTNGATDIFVRDRVAHTTTRVSVAADGRELNSWNWSSTLSADGRYVAFYTNATNAVPGDTTVGHVVIRELRTGQVQVLAAADHPSLSTDGRYLAHLGWGADPAVGSGLYVEDLRTGQTRTVAVDAVDRSTYYDATPRISADGHHVTFATPARLTPDDTAWVQDVYVWNDRP